MARKKKRASRKITKEKSPVVDDNEQAFLNFVDQNARKDTGSNEVVDQNVGQTSVFDEVGTFKFGEIDSGSDSSSSASSLSGSGGSFHVDSGFDELAIDMREQKSTKKRGRPPKKRKVSNKVKSAKGSSSTIGKGKQADMSHQGPQCEKEELKACFAVIKKIMEMDEAKPFSSPVDPVSLGIPDYFDVIDTPMDFGTIYTNLQNCVKYLNAEDVYKDVKYIWENCLKYNKKGDYIVYLMKRAKKKLTKYWAAAGLKSEILTKTSDDQVMRHSRRDAVSLVNRMVGNINQMQQDDFGMIHPQSQVPLPCHSQPYPSHQAQSAVPLPAYSQPHQLHQPQFQLPPPSYSQPYQLHQAQPKMPQPIFGQQPCQSHQPQSQVPLPSYSQNPYQSHQPQSKLPLPDYHQPYRSHQAEPGAIKPPQFSRLEDASESNDAGNSHPLPSSDHFKKRHSKRDTISTVSHTVGCQIQPNNFCTIQAKSQMPIHNQRHESHQPQPSTTQPQLFQSQAAAESNHAGNSTVCNHMQQDNFCSSWLQSQVPLLGYKQPCQSHQPQASTCQPPQFSESQAGKESNYAEPSNLAALMGRSERQKRIATRSSMASMMGTNSMQKQSNPSSCNLWQSQLSTCQPQLSHSHGNPVLPTVDRTIEQSVPESPPDLVVVKQSELHIRQPPYSCNEPNEMHRPQSSTRPQLRSHPLGGSNISSAGLPNAKRRERRLVQRSTEDLCVGTPLLSCHDLPQQHSGSHSHPDSSEQPAEKTKKRTRGRGPTLCRNMWDVHDGERIAVPINKLGEPVGPEASKLSTFLGTVARNSEMAPLTFVDWFAMPDEKKESMWKFVQKKFDIDPMCKMWVLRSIASKWRNWKAKLKSYHYYPHKTDKERLKDRDNRVLPEQWAILVSYWSSEEAQLRSAKNKANRANQRTPHAAGSKSFARIREEERVKKPDGKEPTRAELYIKTRTRKDGQPLNDVAAEIISKLRERETQKQQTSHDSNDLGDALFEVMGKEQNGHVHTYGLDPTPSDLRGKKRGRMELIRMASEAKKSANEEVSKMLGKMEAMEQKYASMEAQIAKMTSSMQNFFEKMGVGEPSKGLGSKQLQAHSSSSHEVPSN